MNLSNTQFVFESKTKRNLIIGMLLGVISLAWIAYTDDEYHTRLWTSWLHNSVYFTGLAFMALFFGAAQITAFGGWNTVIKRVWESMSQFLWVGIILMSVIIIGVWGHFHHLYHWNTPGITDPTNAAYDKIIAGKSGFLNPVFFSVSILAILAIWYFWGYNIHKLSVRQDTEETASFDIYKKIRKWAASFLPLGGFLSGVFLWQSVMSVDPHWYSTMFAWYSMISVWLGSISMTIMLIIWLKSRGYMEYVSRNHLHDLGKFLFGISVFWMYLWFDQFMLIWYANNGEETIYFNERMNHYPVLFWGNLILNFVTPFFVLMRNDTKRKYGTLFFVALIVFFGHWWDYFYMIKPGARIAAFEAKELSEGKTHKEKHKMSSAHTAPIEEHTAPATETANPAEATAKTTEPVEHTAAEAGKEAGKATVEAAKEGTPAEPAAAEPKTEEPHPAIAAAGESGHGEGHEGAEAVGPDKSFKLGYTIPGLDDLGVLIGFLSLFLYFFFNQLSKASLVPRKDPFLDESLHHDTGALIDTEQEEEGHGHHH